MCVTICANLFHKDILNNKVLPQNPNNGIEKIFSTNSQIRIQCIFPFLYMYMVCVCVCVCEFVSQRSFNNKVVGIHIICAILSKKLLLKFSEKSNKLFKHCYLEIITQSSIMNSQKYILVQRLIYCIYCMHTCVQIKYTAMHFAIFFGNF